VKRALLIFALCVALFYIGDFLSVRFGFPGHRPTYGSVMVRRTLAVPEKDQKHEDYYFPEPEAQTCVNSIFPHFGYTPCWYLQRHATQTVQF
jgi:hypothetical protein